MTKLCEWCGLPLADDSYEGLHMECVDEANQDDEFWKEREPE